MDIENNRVKKSLRYSILDGIFACSMTGFTQDYFIPFLLFLGGSVKAVGALAALPNLFASLVQLKSADFTEKVKSRRKVITIFVLLQALMLVPMALIALFDNVGADVFIGVVIAFTCLGAFATSAWGSLMSDLIAQEKRGEYFGWRNKVLGFVLVGSTFIAGFILQKMKLVNIGLGFALIFTCAFLFRMISWYFLGRMHEPSLDYDEKNRFSFIDFISRIKESNFAKFVLFVALMNFSVNIASPFFAVLMLRDLHFSYILYTTVTVSATWTVYIMISRWGRLADKIGNLRVLRFTSPIIGLIPLLWVINRHPLYLVFMQVISGFVWAGFNLCASNFIYDVAIPEKRTRCIAYFNVLNGLALCFGALLGSMLVSRLPALLGYRILSLCVISSVLRLSVALIIPSRLKEVRSVEKVKSTDIFFSMIGTRPLLGIERKTLRY